MNNNMPELYEKLSVFGLDFDNFIANTNKHGICKKHTKKNIQSQIKKFNVNLTFPCDVPYNLYNKNLKI